ncbi:MAG: universal stress protein [Pseudomonadota bacterium]
MYKSILVPVDLGDETSFDNALPVAASLAAKDGAEIHVLTVLPTSGMSVVSSYLPEDYAELTSGTAKKALSAALEDKRSLCGTVTVKGHVARGSVYQEIISAAQSFECDAIVMTAHRPELKDYLLGPNAARVVRHAPQSVMVVRD